MSALGDQVNGSSKLHIVEKIGMDFMIQNAILNVPELTKLKVSGHLPKLHVNLSDTKYSKSNLTSAAPWPEKCFRF
jgi:vacuolar protein sorting-associated protein 13A/C